MASDAAPHLELPPEDGPNSPVADRLTRVREVSSDLEAIFGQPGQLPVLAPRAQAQVATRRSGPREASRRSNLASVGVVSAAALAGVAIGSLLARVPQFARIPAPVAIDSLMARVPELTAAPVDIGSLMARAPAFARTHAPAAIGSLMARVPQFAHTHAPAASAPQPEQPDSTPIPALALPPLQEPQTVDASLVKPPAPSTHKPKARVVHAHVRTAHRPRPSYDCCSHAQVEAADRRLRDAYALAVRSGVPRGEIVLARDRWSAARHRAAHDPLGLVADYRDIADDLNRASNKASSRATASDRTYAREDSGRFQPRYAAWWR
jgi:hypothetical protein